MIVRLLLTGFVVASAALLATTPALGAGGNYVFSGGTPFEQLQVRQGLGASSFNWSLVPARVTISIAPGQVSEAVPGRISLDANLLDSGEWSWGVVQHEYAHEVDFFLFDSAIHAELQTLLGAADWCYEVPGLRHDQQGCERFASTLAWAYWPVAENCMKPSEVAGESGGMSPSAFRALLTAILGASSQNAATQNSVTSSAQLAATSSLSVTEMSRLRVRTVAR